MILHKSRILWWSQRVRWGSCLFWTLWIGIQSNETQTAGKNFTHLPMLDQDYLDGFHPLANSSAQTEAPSFARNDSQNVAEKDPSNLGRGSTHLGQHAQKRWIPWSRGLAFVVFFDQKSRLLRRVSMLWGCLSCFKDGEFWCDMLLCVWRQAHALQALPKSDLRQVIEGSTNNLEEEGRVTSVAACFHPTIPSWKKHASVDIAGRCVVSSCF